MSVVTEALQEVGLFRQLTASELEGLARQTMRRTCARHETIFLQGDPADGLYIVMVGHVAISRQGTDGSELILSVYEPGEYFGELALFDEEPRSATASAIDECSLLLLPRGGFRSFIEQHPAAVFTCLAVIVRHLRQLTDLADEIALMDVRSRLARRLLRLADQGVVEGTIRPARSSFRITQQQLASMLGTTRESVNKHLGALIDQRIIEIDRGHIRVLDIDRLRACSDGLA